MTTATLTTAPFYVMPDPVTLHVPHEQTGGGCWQLIALLPAAETVEPDSVRSY